MSVRVDDQVDSLGCFTVFAPERSFQLDVVTTVVLGLTSDSCCVAETARDVQIMKSIDQFLTVFPSIHNITIKIFC